MNARQKNGGNLPAYRMGDRVLVPFGTSRVPGIVTEDRGPLGKGGLHIYQVEVMLPPSEPMRFEAREDELEPAAVRA